MNANDNFYQYYKIKDGGEEETLRFSAAVQVGDSTNISCTKILYRIYYITL